MTVSWKCEYTISETGIMLHGLAAGLLTHHDIAFGRDLLVDHVFAFMIPSSWTLSSSSYLISLA